MCVGDNPIAQDYNFFSDLENDDLNPKSSIFFFFYNFLQITVDLYASRTTGVTSALLCYSTLMLTSCYGQPRKWQSHFASKFLLHCNITSDAVLY